MTKKEATKLFHRMVIIMKMIIRPSKLTIKAQWRRISSYVAKVDADGKPYVVKVPTTGKPYRYK